MAYDNQKYTDHKEIASRLARIHKNKIFYEDDILEWCQECETDYVGDVDNMFKYLQVGLTVINSLAKAPCNIFRVMEIYSDPDNNNSKVQNNYDGKYFNLGSDYAYDYVYINYYGTPIDELTGVPLIVRGHEAACEAYCVYQMYYEDILTDKISIDAKDRITNDMINKTRACRGDFRHITRQDLEKVIIIRHSMITQIGTTPLYHREFA